MSKGVINFSKDNEYYTPKKLVDYFGKFDYDPATTKEKADEFGILNFDTIETDGLQQDWTKYNRIWINPPFTRKHEFFAKAKEAFDEAGNEIYMLFPIEFLTTKRFHNISNGGGVYVFLMGELSSRVGLVKKLLHQLLVVSYTNSKIMRRLFIWI